MLLTTLLSYSLTVPPESPKSTQFSSQPLKYCPLNLVNFLSLIPETLLIFGGLCTLSTSITTSLQNLLVCHYIQYLQTCSAAFLYPTATTGKSRGRRKALSGRHMILSWTQGGGARSPDTDGRGRRETEKQKVQQEADILCLQTLPVLALTWKRVRKHTSTNAFFLWPSKPSQSSGRWLRFCSLAGTPTPT